MTVGGETKQSLSISKELAKRGLTGAQIAEIGKLFSEIAVFGPTNSSRMGNTVQYLDFLAEFEKVPVSDLAAAVSSYIPQLYVKLIPWPCYKIRNGAYSLGPIDAGDPALFWNGTGVEEKRYDPVAERVGEFDAVMRGAISQQADTIIDFGAGFGFFSLYAASRWPNITIVNIERDLVAAVGARLLIKRFGLQDRIKLLVADINAVGPDFWQAIRNASRGRVVLTTRAALHPYFDDQQYRALFAQFRSEAGIVGGSHSELTGHHSAGFQLLQRQFRTALTIGRDYTEVTSDPFALLRQTTDAVVTDDAPLPPQFLHDRFISRLTWRAAP